MNQFIKIICLALSLLWVSACTTTQFTPSLRNQAFEPRTSPKAIALFRSTVPKKKYFELGTARVCCSTNKKSMIETLREQAAEKGGDALIDVGINSKGSASATVIRYE